MPTPDGLYQRDEFAAYEREFQCARCGSAVTFDWKPDKGRGGVKGYIPGLPTCTAPDCEFHKPQLVFETRVVPRSTQS